MRIPLVIQHRHIHLSLQDQKNLFDVAELPAWQDLSHVGQFVSTATLDVHGPTGFLSKVHVLGPVRKQTQVELSPSEALAIGLVAPVRLSGDTSHSATCVIKSEHNELRLVSCVIIPARHLHLSDQMAKEYHLQQGQIVDVQTIHEPFTRVGRVTVRVHPTFANELHLTSDEAAEHWLRDGDCFSLCDISS